MANTKEYDKRILAEIIRQTLKKDTGYALEIVLDLLEESILRAEAMGDMKVRDVAVSYLLTRTANIDGVRKR